MAIPSGVAPTPGTAPFSKIDSFEDLFKLFTDLSFGSKTAVGIIAGLFVILLAYGGIQLMVQTDPEKKKKTYIFLGWVVGGAVIAIFAFAIVQVIVSLGNIFDTGNVPAGPTP